MYAHLAILCVPVIGALLILWIKGASGATVRQHAVEAVNFQVTAMAAIAGTALFAFVTGAVIILLVVAAGAVVLAGAAGLAAYEGRSYRYPVSVRLLT
jgi:uncharacterized Tic20 family protein